MVHKYEREILVLIEVRQTSDQETPDHQQLWLEAIKGMSDLYCQVDL